MDAFEKLISSLLNSQGFWVKQSFKVTLTKEDKAKIERLSIPRWEVDLIAYKPDKNEPLVIECKSLLDSHGVYYNHFIQPASNDRYKLFNDANLRTVVLNRLRRQLIYWPYSITNKN